MAQAQMMIHIPASSQVSEFNHGSMHDNLFSPSISGSMAHQSKMKTTIKRILDSKLGLEESKERSGLFVLSQRNSRKNSAILRPADQPISNSKLF